MSGRYFGTPINTFWGSFIASRQGTKRGKFVFRSSLFKLCIGPLRYLYEIKVSKIYWNLNELRDENKSIMSPNTCKIYIQNVAHQHPRLSRPSLNPTVNWFDQMTVLRNNSWHGAASPTKCSQLSDCRNCR